MKNLKKIIKEYNLKYPDLIETGASINYLFENLGVKNINIEYGRFAEHYTSIQGFKVVLIKMTKNIVRYHHFYRIYLNIILKSLKIKQKNYI